MNDREFALFRQWIYRQSGMVFRSPKRSFVKSRIEGRMKLYPHLRSKMAYFEKLLVDRDEQQQFIEALTTNETYFFREFGHLRYIGEEIVPQRYPSEREPLLIWSAGCATGEEVYSIAIVLAEMLPHHCLRHCEVIGTDINEAVLRHAERGIYSARSVAQLPLLYLEKYFTKRQLVYVVNESLRLFTQFQQANLYDKQSLVLFQQIDIIFCRNVLIYFDDESQLKVLHHFWQALKYGGILIVGHSDLVKLGDHPFVVERHDDVTILRKR